MSTLATAQQVHRDPADELDERLCSGLRQLAAQQTLPASCRPALVAVFRTPPSERQRAWLELTRQADFSAWLRGFDAGEPQVTEFRRSLMQRLAAAGDAPRPAPEPSPMPASEVPTLLARLASDAALDGRLYQLISAADCLRTLSAQLAEAQRQGDLAEWVRTHRDRLDRALYTPYRAEQLADELATHLVGSEAETLAVWLREQQAAGRRTLAQYGLERVDPTPGSPFQPGEVAPKPGAPPKPTRRVEWHDRVAEVSPGDGGYRLAGRMVCPALARRYTATA